jgi:hypothetical protein
MHSRNYGCINGKNEFRYHYAVGWMMRINVRLDEQSEQDLQFIRQSTGETVTQIVKTLLSERAKNLRENQKPGLKLKALLESDFIGCGEGPDLLLLDA